MRSGETYKVKGKRALFYQSTINPYSDLTRPKYQKLQKQSSEQKFRSTLNMIM